MSYYKTGILIWKSQPRWNRKSVPSFGRKKVMSQLLINILELKVSVKARKIIFFSNLMTFQNEIIHYFSINFSHRSLLVVFCRWITLQKKKINSMKKTKSLEMCDCKKCILFDKEKWKAITYTSEVDTSCSILTKKLRNGIRQATKTMHPKVRKRKVWITN